MKIQIDSSLDQIPMLDEVIFGCPELGAIDPDAVRLCLVEAVTNVIIHGYDRCSGHPVRVSLEEDMGDLVAEIRDLGRPIPESVFRNAEADIEYDPDDIQNLPEGGFGMHLIFMLSRRMDYSRDGTENVLRIEFDSKPD